MSRTYEYESGKIIDKKANHIVMKFDDREQKEYFFGKERNNLLKQLNNGDRVVEILDANGIKYKYGEKKKELKRIVFPTDPDYQKILTRVAWKYLTPEKVCQILDRVPITSKNIKGIHPDGGPAERMPTKKPEKPKLRRT